MIFVLIWLACGLLSAFIASGKNRNPIGWFFIGAIFGVFGLIAALVVSDPNPRPMTIELAATSEPTKRCPDCAESILEAAKKCRHCGHLFESADNSPA
ncbi:MAG: zinc ribbon domain-containing protein [Parvibaculaceae bacterium]|nr:zinc ribbon domain-containing protein [Parvibaculaceae bacterium]